jgi:branched-chain amino acid transport system substrate-binding protein
MGNTRLAFVPTVLNRRTLIESAIMASGLPLRRVRAQAQTIRIGVLNDQSGPYRDLGGMNSVACVRQAVQDFGEKGFEVDVIFADHQNKPDIGARRWWRG